MHVLTLPLHILFLSYLSFPMCIFLEGVDMRLKTDSYNIQAKNLI